MQQSGLPLRIEHQTGWSIKKFVRTARRYRTVQIRAGQQTESPWFWWRLGLLDFDQGWSGPFRSAEDGFELYGLYVVEVAVQTRCVVPVHPAQSGQFDILDGLPGPAQAGP